MSREWTKNETERVSPLEHEYILAALNGLCSSCGLAIFGGGLQGGDVAGLAIGMGKAAYKSVVTAEKIPTSVLHKPS